jgi:hypothetical protein
MSEAFGADCGIRLRHALAFAPDLWRRIVVNKEATEKVARTMGFPREQIRGAARLLRSLPCVPSPERLALVVMRDHGLDNDDIAEIFDRSPTWAATVREWADEIREAEPIRWDLEYLDDGVQPGDPDLAEVYRLASELRSKRVLGGGRRSDLDTPPSPISIRAVSWRGNAFISFSA